MDKKRKRNISKGANEHKKLEEEIKKIEKKEESIAAEEKKIETETQKVENIEKDIKKSIEPKPLTRFSMNDLNKGIIGAFIGVAAHFGFIYGKAIAQSISTARATLLLTFSYFLIILLMYETGYREIKERRLFFVLPRRATLIYLTSIVVVVVILILFNMIDFSNYLELYKQVAVISVLAVLGAGTADLIGRR